MEFGGDPMVEGTANKELQKKREQGLSTKLKTYPYLVLRKEFLNNFSLKTSPLVLVSVIL